MSWENILSKSNIRKADFDITITGYNLDTDFNYDQDLTQYDYGYNKNPSFISTCSYLSGDPSIVSVRTDLSHNLNVGDIVIIKNVTDTINTTGAFDSGYNGTFTVSGVTNDMEFKYETTQSAGNITNNLNLRDTSLPRFERNDLQKNLYIYRNEVISEYIPGNQDGVYHLYVLKADNKILYPFGGLEYSQNVRDLYPQMDMDNPNDNPQSSKSFAVRSPLGKVVMI